MAERLGFLSEAILATADEIFDVASYEDCEKVLNETLGDTDTSATNETTRYNNTTTTTTDNGMEGVSDIESAFDDLLA